MGAVGMPEMIFVFLAVGAVALFSFLAVASWADSRRREREMFYRSEAIKKIAETQGAGATTALEILREEERIASRKRRDGIRLGGLVNIGVGLGLMIFLGQLTGERGISLVGLIPGFIGVALLLHSYVLAPKE